MSAKRKPTLFTREERTALKERAAQRAAAAAAIPRDGNGWPISLVVDAVLNAPKVGLLENLGDLILKAIAPEIIDSDKDSACEPPEAAHLRLLANELKAIAGGIDSGDLTPVDVANTLRGLACRTDASAQLAWRLRESRWGTSPIWGGVTKARAAGGSV